MKDIVITRHPFGKGLLTTTGVQYGTAVTTIASTATWTTVDTATIVLPVLGTPAEVECGLTAARGSAGTTNACSFKWQGSDDGTTYIDLCATAAGGAATTYVDQTYSGRLAATTSFTFAATPLYIRLVGKPAATTNAGKAKVKNSSYVRFIYRH